MKKYLRSIPSLPLLFAAVAALCAPPGAKAEPLSNMESDCARKAVKPYIDFKRQERIDDFRRGEELTRANLGNLADYNNSLFIEPGEDTKDAQETEKESEIIGWLNTWFENSEKWQHYFASDMGAAYPRVDTGTEITNTKGSSTQINFDDYDNHAVTVKLANSGFFTFKGGQIDAFAKISDLTITYDQLAERGIDGAPLYNVTIVFHPDKTASMFTIDHFGTTTPVSERDILGVSGPHRLDPLSLLPDVNEDDLAPRGTPRRMVTDLYQCFVSKNG